jgi:hypothetical protein
MTMRNRLRCLALLIASVSVCGCGSDEAYKLEAKPEVDYEALEKASSAEEDVSQADVRALEN